MAKQTEPKIARDGERESAWQNGLNYNDNTSMAVASPVKGYDAPAVGGKITTMKVADPAKFEK